MKRILIILLFLVAILAVGGYFLVKYAITPTALPVKVIDAEEALAAKGTVAIASVDMTYVRRIEKLLNAGNDPSPLPPVHSKEAKSLLDKLKNQGVDIVTSTDYALGAINVAQKKPAYSLLLLGRYSPEKFIQAIEKHYLVEKTEQGYLLITQNPEQVIADPCAKPSIPPVQQALQVRNDRIILSSPGFMPVLLKRFSEKALAGVALANWRKFRKEKAIAGAVIKPVEAKKGAIDMPSAAILGALSQQPLKEIYAGAVISFLPEPGFSLLIDAHADTEQWPLEVKTKFDAWQKEVALVLKDLPTLSVLINSLNLQADGSVLRFKTHANKKTLDNLEKVPGEFLQMAFSGIFDSGKGRAPGEEKIISESELEKYLPQFDLSAVEEFDPKSSFYAPDYITGPMGIRLKKIGLLDTDDSVVQLEIIAEGKGFENLPSELLHQSIESPVAGLSITAVEDKDGNNLLREELCGKNRNLASASLNTMRDKEFKDEQWISRSIKVSGDKKVRLKPHTPLSSVAMIKGNVSIQAATKTRVYNIKPPFTGKTIETKNVRMYLRKKTPGSVRYTISGELNHILSIRAKNAKGQYLAASGSSASGKDTKMVSKRFMGKVASIEVIVAESMQTTEYPFAINNIEPRYGKRGDGTTQAELIVTSKKRFLKQHKNMKYKKDECKGKQKVRAGAFLVCMNQFGRKWGTRVGGDFEIFAPYDVALQNDLSAGTLSVDNVITDTGEVINFNKNTNVSFNYKFEMKYDKKKKSWDVINRRLHGANISLYSENEKLKDKNISKITGTLTIRLPKRTSHFDLGARNLGIVETNRNGVFAAVSAFEDWSTYIDLTGKVEKVMRFLPIANDGKILNTGNDRINRKQYRTFGLSEEEKKKIDALPEKWEGMITIYGKPEKIRVIYANRFETIRHKFQFTTGEIK